jgi:predicted MFS family arabinose efflux permease
MECVEKCRLVAFLHNADDVESAAEAGHLYGGLFLPSLVISYFATSPLGIVTGLFLLKMAETFGVDKGFMGQINTFSSIVSVVFALLMGVLSVRLRHKSLLLIGLLFLGVSAVGCYFA